MSSLRTLQPETVTLINSGDLVFILLLKLGYSPSPVLANNSNMPIDFNGETYLGAGSLGAVDGVRDTTGEIVGLKFALSGATSEAVALALAQPARGKRCQLWLAACSSSPIAVVEAIPLFDGQLDQMPISFKLPTSTIAVTAIHAGQVMARGRAFVYTDGDQQAAAPGDTSGRFLISQANHQDVWPASTWRP